MEKFSIEHLSGSRIFSSLTREELQEISGKIAIRSFPRNKMILREEDTSHYMYVILIGKVKVVRTSQEGKEIVLTFHQAGESFGEIALIDGQTSRAAVVAVQDTLAAIISKKDFSALLLSQPKVLNNLLHILCFRLREAWETVQMLNLKNASERIRTLFLKLSDGHGITGPDGVTLEMKLTHQEIADMTGLTRETVTRVIDKWRRAREILVLKNRHIHLSSNFF